MIDVSPKQPVEPTYLGDGVYAAFDGYGITLHVGAHDNPPVVYLEPDVLDALTAYRHRCHER